MFRHEPSLASFNTNPHSAVIPALLEEPSVVSEGSDLLAAANRAAQQELGNEVGQSL